MSGVEASQLAQLNQGLKTLSLALSTQLSEQDKQKLITFLSLISKWNHTYNLTSITEPEKMVTHHLLDSLSINLYLKGRWIIDVGTGAGLPGIPLAIANPDKQFVLLDSLTKRTTFLQQVCYQLKLDNVTIVTHRVEDYQPEIIFDQIITRAFASLGEMLQSTKHLIKASTQVLAMKGSNYQEELELIGDTYTIISINKLKVPGLGADRNLIILEGSCSG